MNLNQEIWRVIKNFPRYEISNHGRVRNLLTRKIYKLHLKTDGHQSLRLDGIHKRVNRIVAETFLDNDDKYKMIEHIDGNPLNNHVTNLRWV